MLMIRPVLVLLACLAGSVSAWATEAGVVTHLSGSLRVRLPDGSFKLLGVESTVNNGETLITHERTYARVKFIDGAEVVLRPDSRLTITEVSYRSGAPEQDNFALGLLKGGLRMVTGLLGKRNRERVSVNTLTATIGIRGTHFGLLMCQEDCGAIPTISGGPLADGLHVDVAEGAIQVSNPAGQMIIVAGQFGYVQSNMTPPAIVPPSQGIQVTMPSSISQNDAAGQSVGQGRTEAECAVR